VTRECCPATGRSPFSTTLVFSSIRAQRGQPLPESWSVEPVLSSFFIISFNRRCSFSGGDFYIICQASSSFRDPMFNRFDTIPACDGLADGQTDGRTHDDG